MNNRELASAILIFLVFALGMTRKDVRQSFYGVLEALRVWKVWLTLVAYTGFMAACVWCFWWIELWNSGLLAETIIWVFISGLPIVLSFSESGKSPSFFRDHIKSIFQIGGVFLFFVNLETLSFFWEFILQMIFISLVLMGVISSNDDKYKSVQIFVNIMIVILLSIMAIYSVTNLLANRSDTDWWQILLSFLASLWLPLYAIAFLFPLSVIAGYEIAFIRFIMPRDARKPMPKDKLALILIMRLRLRDIHKFKPYWGRRIMDATSFADKCAVVREFLADQDERRLVTERENQSLIDFSGIRGEDRSGKQLDRREFGETVDALHWIYTYQLGQYKNRQSSYSPLLEMLPGNHGLSAEHGITLVVSKDGQSWYAWRRVVTGWISGVGASGPPPDKWYFDGPNPPTVFPGDEAFWDHWLPGKNAQNWE